jgi:hypothetical protein
MKPEKTEVPSQSRCDTIKIPPCLKALSDEYIVDIIEIE